jgi:hypothetical protein
MDSGTLGEQDLEVPTQDLGYMGMHLGEGERLSDRRFKDTAGWRSEFSRNAI